MPLSARQPWRWQSDLPVLAVLTVAVLVLAWSQRAVLVTSDPWHYAMSAVDFGDHEWIPAGLTRWGIIVPLVPVAAVFGPTLPTFYAFALLATALVVPVVYILTRWVASIPVAVLTVVAFVAQPLTFINLTRGYPDLMAVALSGLTLILVLRACDTGHLSLLLAAGLAAGWAFEVRETTVFVWPLFAWLIWRAPGRWRGYAMVVLGLLPWVVLDVTLSSLQFADPLAKWHVLTSSDLNDSTSVLDASYLGQDRWWYLARLPVAIFEQPWGWTVLLVAVLGAAGGLLMRGRVGVYVVWALLPALLLLLQAGVLDPEHPSVRVDVPRYWLAFTPGLTIAAVAACARLAESRRAPGWVGAAVLTSILVASGARFAASEPTLLPNGGGLPYETVAALPGDALIWTDGRTSRILPVYAESAGRKLTFGDFTARDAQPSAGDFVLIFSDTDTTCEFCKLDYDQWRANGKSLDFAALEPVWTSPDGRARLFEVR